MVPIPDAAKPYVDGFLKYHFWILAAIVPFVLLPSVFSANGGLRQKIQSQKSAIDGHTSALQAIQNEPDHPNSTWVEAVDNRTKKLRGDILDQWQIFWTSQQPLRAWPPELGQDFLAAIQEVEQGSQTRLPANLLQRYQNTVPDLVRKLPLRMGCKDLTLEPTRGAVGGGQFQTGSADDTENPEASLTLDPLVWKGENQKRLLESFTWAKEPSTVQVQLAQEELWVYGLFCDVIHKLNEGATGAFNATITSVDELLVAHPAAEEAPGGQGGSRILWKSSPTPTVAIGEEAMPVAGAGSEPAGRPSHPRFGAAGVMETSSAPAPLDGQASVEGGVGADGMPAATSSPDDPFREWIYVDFQGKPLAAAQLPTSQDATMVHLMPFTLRVVMDQRKIDRLIEELAENPIPIDVRQVRINPGQSGMGAGGSFSSSTSGSANTAADALGRSRRPYDVTVELRGTVGLATPPDEKPLGGGEVPVEGVAGGLE
jgi:hypothetical protein